MKLGQRSIKSLGGRCYVRNLQNWQIASDFTECWNLGCNRASFIPRRPFLEVVFFAVTTFRQQRVAKHQQQQMKTSTCLKQFCISILILLVLIVYQCYTFRSESKCLKRRLGRGRSMRSRGRGRRKSGRKVRHIAISKVRVRDTYLDILLLQYLC